MMQGIWKTGAGVVLGAAILTSAFAAPFLAPARADRIAGILFGPTFDDRTSIDAIVKADPNVKIVDIRFKGRLVYVRYEAPAFPARVADLGALHTFDAVAAGCHRDDTTRRRPKS